MRAYYVTVTMIGLCVASLGAWLSVSLLNEFAGPGLLRDEPRVLSRPDAAGAQPSPAPSTDMGRTAGGDAVAASESRALTDEAAGVSETEREGAEFGTATGTGGRDAALVGMEKTTDRIAPPEPTAPAPRMLPEEAGPYRAAFIREPPSEAEFPVIRLATATWRVENGIDGTVSGRLDILAEDQNQSATLRLSGAVSSDGDTVFLVTLSLEAEEFMPESGTVRIEAVTARGRGDRSVRIPATTLPYENSRVIDFRVSAEAMLATFSFAAWFDVAIRTDEGLYAITIENGDATREILRAVAYGT